MNAKALRLREALQEYVSSVTGDTRGHRGDPNAGINRHIPETERKLVEQAQTLLAGLGGGEGSTGDHAARNTPGSRSRDAAQLNGQQAPAGWGRDAARALLGGAPASTPAPSGDNNGAPTT